MVKRKLISIAVAAGLIAGLVGVLLHPHDTLHALGAESADDSIGDLRRIVGTLLGLAVAWLTCVMMDLFVWRAMVQRRTGMAPPKLLVAMVRVAIVFAVVAFIAAYVYERPLTGLLVSSGVVGIVLGFALQRTISDFFSGISLNVERSLRVGDWVQIDSVTGRVVEINWRATHLLTLDQVTVVLPNSYIAENRIMNYNLPRDAFRAHLEVGLEYGVPIPDARRVLLAGVRAAEGVQETPAPDVLVTQFGASAIVYRIRFYVASYQRMQNTIDAVATSVNHHLFQAGLSIPFPKRDVFYAPMPPREIDRRHDRVALVRRIELFQDLTDAELTALGAGLRERRYCAGDRVVRQGEDGQTLFVVVEGLLDVRVDDGAHARKVAALEAGDFFGEATLLTGEPRSASVVAASESLLYEVDRDTLSPIIQARPELAERLSGVLAKRRAQTQARLARPDHPIGPTDRRTLAADFLKRIQGFFGID